MQARRLPAARGIFWVTAGFSLYRRAPALLVMLTMFYLIAAIGSGLLAPVGPVLLALALPALTVLVANGCRLIDRPPGIALDHAALLDGLKSECGPLLRLGGLQLAATLLVLGIDWLFDASGGAPLALAEEALEPEHMARLLVIVSPMLLAFWFAPLLTAWDRVPPTKSLFFSLVASLRNWRAFLAYAAAVALVGVVLPGLVLLTAAAISASALELMAATLRLALLLVLVPVLMASVYLSYCDVFARSVSVDA